MKLVYTFAVFAVSLAPMAAEDDPRITLNEEPSKHRFRLGGTVLLNANMEYKTGAGAGGTAQPGPPTGGVDHIYDDGYNRVDSSGNMFPPNATSYWGYDNASQLLDSPSDPFVGIDSIAMSATVQSGASQSFEDTADPQLGFEIGYGQVLRESGNWRWGAEGMLGYTHFDMDDKNSGQTTLTSLTDVYSLNVNGIIVTPPTAPYEGPFSATPGSPLIGDTPTRTSSSSSGSFSAKREFKANILIARLGPFAEYKVSEEFSLAAGAGLALLFVDSEFRYQDTLNFTGGTGPQTTSQRGSNDEFDALFGGYVGLQAQYEFTEDLAVYGGVQYIGTDEFESKDNGQEATLDLSESLWISAGLSLAF